MKEVVRRLQRRIIAAVWLVTAAGGCIAVAVWVSQDRKPWYYVALAAAVLALTAAMVVLPTTYRIEPELEAVAEQEES